MQSEDTDTRTTAVRETHRFDKHALATWMAENVAGFAGPLLVSQFEGGQSNPTYRLSTPQKDYVMRRKPSGQIAKGAHAIEREAKVLRALEGTDVPVAHVHGLCTDETVIGTWFYVMDFLDGRIIWDTSFPDVARDERPTYFDAMNRSIAALHSLDPAALGLSDYGRAGNYFDRQITRWSRQYREDGVAGRDEHLERLCDWLPAHIPPGDETRIVHGDFRCENLMFHPSRPEVLAVLDWELSTLGHPLADFAFHLMMYRMPSLLVAGLAERDIAMLNIPQEAEYVAAYCERTGRTAIPDADLRFYVAFNMFRLASIFHGIKGRLIRGNAASANAPVAAESVAPLAALAWQQVA